MTLEVPFSIANRLGRGVIYRIIPYQFVPTETMSASNKPRFILSIRKNASNLYSQSDCSHKIKKPLMQLRWTIVICIRNKNYPTTTITIENLALSETENSF
jgi:hypothetical protein